MTRTVKNFSGLTRLFLSPTGHFKLKVYLLFMKNTLTYQMTGNGCTYVSQLRISIRFKNMMVINVFIKQFSLLFKKLIKDFSDECVRAFE